MKRWQWAIRLLSRRMWFRAALFCLFAVLLALAAPLIGRAISNDFATRVGAQSVDSILNVLASSMLAVTTFSLTAMVSAYSGATSNITPRAVQLLVEDRTAQNALATFLGSFLFAVVGIIALSTGVYDETGRVILYAGTILVIAVIALTLLGWIEHITHFGRMSDTIDRVERAATEAVCRLAQSPRFGLCGPTEFPDGATVIFHDGIGRVTHVDVVALSRLAKKIELDIYLEALPGTLVDPARTVAWTRGEIGEDGVKQIRQAFTLANHRVFDQDPRFGLVVLSEIASRALSPGVNDPGTAIAAIEAGTRVLAVALRNRPDRKYKPPAGVHVPPVAFHDLIKDLYAPIARDGAGNIEVCIHLQKALGALQVIAPEARDDCEREAKDAFQRASATLENREDRQRLTEVNRRFWPESPVVEPRSAGRG